MKQLLLLVLLTSASNALACADFSGTWTGECQTGTNPPTTATETMTQSGCESLTFDGHHETVIGSIANEGQQTAEFSLSYQTSYNWNSDKSGLLFYETYVKKFIGTPEAKTSVAHGTITLKGQEKHVDLKLNQVIVDKLGATSVVEKIRTCRLVKQ